MGSIRTSYEAFEGDTPQFRRNWWEETFQGRNYVELFEPPKRFETDWFVPTTVDGVKDRALSKSYVAILPTEKKEALVQDLLAILQSSDKDWIDEQSGVFKYPYKTILISMKKKSQ